MDLFLNHTDQLPLAIISLYHKYIRVVVFHYSSIALC